MGIELDADDFAILGLVALRPTATAYDLKRGFSNLTVEFWSVPHTNIYERTRRLLESGLLSAHEEQHGRRRRLYSITHEGRAALERWLSAPETPSIEIRDEALLKLYLSELSGPGDVLELARQQVRAYRARLQHLDEIEERFGADPGAAASRLRPLPMGRATYEGALRFWLKILDEEEPFTGTRAPK